LFAFLFFVSSLLVFCVEASTDTFLSLSLSLSLSVCVR